MQVHAVGPGLGQWLWVLTLARHHSLRVALGQQPRVAIEAGLLHFRRDAQRGEGGIIAAAETLGSRKKPQGNPCAVSTGSCSFQHPPCPKSRRAFFPSQDAPLCLFPPRAATRCRGLGCHHGGLDQWCWSPVHGLVLVPLASPTVPGQMWRGQSRDVRVIGIRAGGCPRRPRLGDGAVSHPYLPCPSPSCSPTYLCSQRPPPRQPPG